MVLLGDRLRWLGGSDFGIGLELRFGNGLDFGSSLAEVAAEEDDSEESAENDGEDRNWNGWTHWKPDKT